MRSAERTEEAGGRPSRLTLEFLRGSYTRLVGLAVSSALEGFAEAAFLLVVTKTALSVTTAEGDVELFGGWTVTRQQSLWIAATIVVIRVGIGMLSVRQSSRLIYSSSRRLNKSMADGFISASWPAQHGVRGGRLQELLTGYTGQASSIVTSVANGTNAAFSLMALLGAAIVVDPAASVVVIAVVVVLSLVLRPLRRSVRRQAKETAGIGMEYATSLSEISDLGMEMHVFSVQQPVLGRIDQLIDRSADALEKLAVTKGRMPVIYSGLAYIAVIIALGVVSTSDTTDVGSAGAAMLVMLRSLTYGKALQSASASIHSGIPYLQVLNEERERLADARLVDRGVPVGRVGDVILRDVTYGYDPARPVLRNINAMIASGEVVGMIGPSGGGKSTLVQILLGLRSPDLGCVLAGGRDIRDFSRVEWSRKVTFVPQAAHLLAGTISDNIRFFRSDVSQDDIERAARLAHLHDDIMKFPETYDRDVGERGSRLSGGQAQRLVIARALVEQPDLLILDEPTSALDVRSESLIRATLNDLRSSMAIIVIAHRLSTLEVCDRLMVIQDGEVKGFDTPEGLERDSDFYREALVLSGLR